jgi:GNAT superfamily N-acetyltransferase
MIKAMTEQTIAIYCFIDDFFLAIGRKEDAHCKLSDAEILTTALLAARYFYGNLNSACRYVHQHHGMYVKPAVRRQGISGKWLHGGEEWVKAKGCTQMGSDIHWNNTVSYDFHTRMGFQEAARLITFIKNLN